MRTRSYLPRIFRIAFFAGVNVILGIYFITQLRLPVPAPVQQLATQLNWELPVGTVPASLELSSAEPDITEESLLKKVNELRARQDVAPLTQNPQLASVAAQLMAVYAKSEYQVESVELDDDLKQLLKQEGYRYQWVSHHALVGPVTIREVGTSWEQHQQHRSAILNPEFTQVGFATTILEQERGKVGVIVQLLAQPQGVQATPTPVKTSPSTWREIPDAEVIDALNAYRQTHGVHPLSVSSQLCTYAEKRVQDLIANGGLDNHAGFRQDFADQSQLPVGIRDYPGGSIGENLAHQYCKNMTTAESFVAQTGTALIEWCFDSSTKGHREAQLNPSFQNVCVRHGDFMYVVIFGE